MSRSGLVNYEKLGWGDDEVRSLAEAIRYAGEHCEMNGDPLAIYIGNNRDITDDGAAEISAVARLCSNKFTVAGCELSA